MADRTERLDKLRSLGVVKGAADVRPVRRRPHALEDLVVGNVLENEAGTFFLAEERLSIEHTQGRRALSDLLHHSPRMAAYLAKDAAIAELHYERAAFVDIETSGLAGGTGTVAFMIGVGFYEADEFCVQQFFMRDYPEEPASLTALGQLLDRFDWVVSFNGKAFDMPLITTRFLMNRMPPRLHDAPHLDLLMPARRFWKRRLPSCRLSALERDVLRFYRDQADVPGYLVPQIYFDYLRTGDAGEIARVFYHNVHDIISLAALAGHMCLLVDAATPAAEPHGQDALQVARLLEEAGDYERAELAYRQALGGQMTPEERTEALHCMAMFYKRLGRRDEAREIWRALTKAQFGDDVASHVELAKDYEHRTKEYDKALRCVDDAIERAWASPEGLYRTRLLSELQHRRTRLLRKQARHAQTDAERTDIEVED